MRCILLVVGMVACGGSGSLDDRDSSSDTSIVRPANPPGDDTYDYAIGFLRPGVTRGDEAPGFDLDGLNSSAGPPASPGCGKRDFRAPTRFGGHPGVDNQLTSVLEAIAEVNPSLDFGSNLQAGIASGGSLFGLRLSNVGDLVDDGRIDVSIVQLRVPGGGAPVMTESIIAGERVPVLAPDQTFEIAPSSLLEGAPRYQITNAFLLGGMLHTESTNFSLRVPTGDRALSLDFRALVSGHVDGAGITDAVLGGWSTIDEIIQSLTSLDDPTVDLALAELLLQGQVDIRSDPSLPRCDALSLAFEASAVRVTLVMP